MLLSIWQFIPAITWDTNLLETSLVDESLAIVRFACLAGDLFQMVAKLMMVGWPV